MKPPVTADLTWERELIFSAQSGAAAMTLDSASEAGPSPVQMLAFALAACMGMDVVHILRKGRHDLRGLRVAVTATRADEDPHRLLTADLRFEINGAIPADAVDRAIQLSRDKYCSVWHSLRQDIRLTTSTTISGT
jgi:putative redox protein